MNTEKAHVKVFAAEVRIRVQGFRTQQIFTATNVECHIWRHRGRIPDVGPCCMFLQRLQGLVPFNLPLHKIHVQPSRRLNLYHRFAGCLGDQGRLQRPGAPHRHPPHQ